MVIGLLGYMMNEKFRELARISILLNKTREEVARDNVTQAEVDRITNHIDQRFNKLEAKIDQLLSAGK
jgi:histidinol phosphatase-like enzyme